MQNQTILCAFKFELQSQQEFWKGGIIDFPLLLLFQNKAINILVEN
jgi:hypothetical protein